MNRLGYGAMQLAGPSVFGPPKDRNAALGVLREAVARGVNHIDTSDYYGPHVTNQLICEALHPYPDDLVIVTKVGTVRGADASWIPALTTADLARAVHDNLRNLRVDALDVVNLRVGGIDEPHESSIEEQFATLAELSCGSSMPPTRRLTSSTSTLRFRRLSWTARAEVSSGERGNPRCVRTAHRADFGHDHKVIGIGMKRLANELVGDVRAVVIAGVDVVHAPRDRLAKHAEGRVSILWRAEHAWVRPVASPRSPSGSGAVAQRENASGSDVGYVSLRGLISDARLS